MQAVNDIKLVIATIAGAIGYFLGGLDGIMITLIIFVSLDYLTGVAVAIMNKTLSSEVGFKGLFKKVFIFVLVGIGAMLDKNILGGSNVLRTAIIFYYIANEGISLCENAGNLGLPIPQKLKDTLAQLKSKTEETTEETTEENKEEN